MKRRTESSRQVNCVSCGKTMLIAEARHEEDAAPQCSECLERSHEKAGVDYDAAELGGEG